MATGGEPEDDWSKAIKHLPSDSKLVHTMNNDDDKWKELFRQAQSCAVETPKDLSYNRLTHYKFSELKAEGFNDRDQIPVSLFEVMLSRDNFRSYMLTPYPIATAMRHFWFIASRENVSAVVALSKTSEGTSSKSEEILHRYISDHSNYKLSYNNDYRDVVEVWTTSRKSAECYIESGIRLVYKQHSMHRTKISYPLHLEFTGEWDEYKVPRNKIAFLQFFWKLRKAELLKSNGNPPIIHCSSGGSRSTMLIAIDLCLALIERNKDLEIDVVNELVLMHERKSSRLAHWQQLKFCYEMVAICGCALKNGEFREFDFSNIIKVQECKEKDEAIERKPGYFD